MIIMVRQRNETVLIAILFLFSLFLSGCVTLKDPEASLEYTADVVGVLTADQSLGQTLISRRPRLNGVQLWLRQSLPHSPPTEILTFELYHTPQETQPLVTVPITYGVMTRSFPLTINFPPQDDPPRQSYYMVLKTRGGPVQIFGRGEDVYPHGELMVNAAPQEADAAFRLSYDYGFAAILSDLGFALGQIWFILPLMIILWLPGCLLLNAAISPATHGQEDAKVTKVLPLDWGQHTALSLGLSLAIIPMVILWTTTLGMRWNRASVVIVAMVLVVFYLWRFSLRFHCSDLLKFTIDKHSLILFGIFLFSLIIRLIMVRDLAAPAWVDPVHHATITRLIVTQGILPKSYAPLVEASTAGYHPGFHSVIAFFHWLSGLDIPTAMLLIGQVLNALSVLAVYLLAVTFTRNRTAGIIAALVTGVFTPMPAYYASWGRYTQLAGMLILPACMALIVRIMNPSWSSCNSATSDKLLSTILSTDSGNKHSPREWVIRCSSPATILITCIACGGLAITHYRVIIFLSALLLAYLIARTIQSLDKQPIWLTIPWFTIRLGVIVIGALLLTLPWWPTFFSTAIAPKLNLAPPAPQSLTIDWGYLTPAYGKQVLILAGIGLAWSMVRARWFGLTLTLWVGLLFMSANQGIVHLPGAGFVNKTSVEIMLFMPLSVLAGYLLACLFQAGRRIIPVRWHFPYHLGLVLIGFVFTLVGTRSLLPILNPITFLFREADKPAMAWISANLSPDETILINPFLWNNGVYAGQDGGYWITPMTGRKSLPPPVLYALGGGEEILRINRICKQVIDQGKDPAILYDLLKQQGIHFIYIGGRGGVLSPKALKESPLFQTIYHQDGVWIFKIRQNMQEYAKIPALR